MDTKGRQIAYQVAFKGAIELVSSGVAQPETDDLAAEITGLATALYDQLEGKLDALGGEVATPNVNVASSGSTPGRPTATKQPSPRSTQQGSGTTQYEFASSRQGDFVQKLLGEKEHEIPYDADGFEWGGNSILWDKIPSGQTQAIIDFLMAQPKYEEAY